ncbi:hypothetical protein PFISCL1PPCAC_13301 [Pristionchus fissidentatus]|uniref:PUM-HD domain-containing protein n=1 Tax=Pristionchus fissidentatus TaxID=1538716 RepID=A0AAV5VUD3_9BILA|nr:hypothetical protein PFISCL1PPCAC_13301 [Pristionchus fissidentatus]
MSMFEMQQHPPVGYDGKQFDNSYSDYVLSPEFGSPPNRCVPPPPQFQQIPSSPSMGATGNPMTMSYSPIVGGSQSGMGMTTSTPRSHRNYNEDSPVKSGRRFNRSQFTPSRSPPTSLLSSPPYFPRNRTHLSDESRDDSNRSYEYSCRPNHRNNTLPAGSFDPQSGQITYTFERIIDEGVFEKFAKDKGGCHFLQENYPKDGSHYRARLFMELEREDGFFEEICKDVFANFFVQRMIEKSTNNELRWIAHAISKSMFALCMNRYSCRVIQKAIEHLPDDMKVPLLSELEHEDLVMLTVDQNANHVIQKIFNSFDLCHWSFIITALIREGSFFSVVENKYGCRVIQLAIELLSDADGRSPHQIAYENATQMERRHRISSVVETGDGVEWATVNCGNIENPTREQLLQQMMGKLVEHCERLSSNEFANYVIQHVITADSLSEYRDLIIERCLLCKLLSLSQEKYASHVVEKALEHAPSHMLKEMMDEIFDGYVPHPDTKKDALDILLFHQFGNYVVQRMLMICLGQSERKKSRLDDQTREPWMARLEDRINRNAGKLLRYSSGKKILDMLRAARGQAPLNLGGTTQARRTTRPVSPINSVEIVEEDCLSENDLATDSPSPETPTSPTSPSLFILPAPIMPMLPLFPLLPPILPRLPFLPPLCNPLNPFHSHVFCACRSEKK